VVVLSSDEEEDSVRALMNAGAVCYVRKGIDLHELSTTLDRAISAHRHAAH
jgi:DNA-binding NarL/FixJ family response regulator